MTACRLTDAAPVEALARLLLTGLKRDRMAWSVRRRYRKLYFNVLAKRGGLSADGKLIDADVADAVMREVFTAAAQLNATAFAREAAGRLDEETIEAVEVEVAGILRRALDTIEADA